MTEPPPRCYLVTRQVQDRLRVLAVFRSRPQALAYGRKAIRQERQQADYALVTRRLR